MDHDNWAGISRNFQDLSQQWGEGMKDSKERRANIRFDEEEYIQICSDAKTYGETIPAMLKAVYFERLPADPKFSKDDVIRIVAAINRVGNNVNQIARHLNNGSDQSQVLAVLMDVAEQLRILKCFAVGTDGSC